jgi:hypothetical protein
MNRRSFIFVLKRYANLFFDNTCILLNLSNALYSLSAKILVHKIYFRCIDSRLDFSGSRLRSWSFHFCVSIFMLAFSICALWVSTLGIFHAFMIKIHVHSIFLVHSFHKNKAPCVVWPLSLQKYSRKKRHGLWKKKKTNTMLKAWVEKMPKARKKGKITVGV